jgi:ribosome-binding factor A
MAFRDQRRADTHFDRIAGSRFDGSQQLDSVAQFIGESNVGRRELIDTLDKDPCGIEPEAVGEGRQDDRLVSGVPSIDIEGGVGLGVAELLRFGERRGKIHPCVGHPAEYVVARAVQDAVNVLEAVANKRFAHHFDNRNTTCHRGFVKHRNTALAGQMKNLLAVLRQQGLVSRHDSFPSADSLLDERQRSFNASHQFDDNANIRVCDQIVSIGREEFSGSCDGARLAEVSDRNAQDLEAGTESLRQQIAVGSEVLVNPGANSAKACEAYADRLTHPEPGSIRLVGELPNENCTIRPLENIESRPSAGHLRMDDLSEVGQGSRGRFASRSTCDADFFVNAYLIRTSGSGEIEESKCPRKPPTGRGEMARQPFWELLLAFGLDQVSKSGRLADSQFAMKHRIERVSEVLKRELGQIILRELTFPTPLVTISGVDITPDLKQAHVYVSAFGTDAQRQDVLSVLEENRGMLQAQISKRVVLKYTPHLNFKLDDSIARGSRVLNILDDLGLDETK